MALYHSAKGSVTYTVVGNPTIIDGVASNFSANDYLQLSSAFPAFGINDSVEILIKCTTPSTLGAENVFGRYNSNSGVNIQTSANGRLYGYVYNSTAGAKANATLPVSTLQVNTSYYFKYTLQNKVLTIAASTDKETWTSASLTLPDDFAYSESVNSVFGGYTSGSSTVSPFNGSIDLNETYIKVNGQPWFGVCPVEVKKHQLMGPVGYTVTGSPTITDGIAGNFSTTDYLSVPYGIDLFAQDSFEYVVAFKIGTASSTATGTLVSLRIQNAAGTTATGSYGIYRYHNTLNAYLGFDSNDTIIQGSIPFTAGEKRQVRWKKQNGVLYLHYSTDGNTWTELANDGGVNNTRCRTTTTILGSLNWESCEIDLNATYIKVNGKLWFYQPAPTKYIVKDDKLVFADQGLYLAGPVNYEMVGSPTITDGIASGFSLQDYFIVRHFSWSKTQKTEFVMRFKVDTSLISFTNNYITFCYGPFATYCYIGADPNPSEIVLASDILNVGAIQYGVLPTNQFCYIKLTTDGDGNASAYKSLDGVSWQLNATRDISATTERTDSTIDFGYRQTKWGLPGSIDLNQTYIKVNDQLWFYGKNYASKNIAPVPANYTYGTTTTSAIGYVDMRTQAFTAAPSGATIGRDE